MLPKRFCQILIVGVAVWAFTAWTPRTEAHTGYNAIPCRCQPSCAVFHSDFYGYYRTCWRPWPGTQPPCPPCAQPPVPVVTPPPAVGAATPQAPPLELLPLPKPEEELPKP
jgi:hypothetical protein